MTHPNGRNGLIGNGGEPSTRYSNILQTLTVVGVAVGGFYAAVLVPMNGQITENRDNVARLREQETDVANRLVDKVGEKFAGYLTKDEHLEFRFRSDRQMDAFKEQLGIVKNEVNYLRDNQVTRSEQSTHWDQSKADTAELRKQIDDLRKDFGGQYTVAEKIKDLQQQLDQMRTASGTSHIQLVPSNAPGPVPRP